MLRTSRDKSGSLRSATHWWWALLASFAWLGACGGSGSQADTATIAKDKFISTYVALRQAAVALDSARLDSARAAILRDAGVTRKDMLTFVEVHGPDVAYMKNVWDTVEAKLNKGPPGGVTVH